MDMNNYEQYLKELDDALEEFDAGGGIGIVGLMRIDIGFFAFHEGATHETYWKYWRVANKKEEYHAAHASLVEALKKDGVASKITPGIKIFVSKDALSKKYEYDQSKFTPRWNKSSYARIFSSVTDGKIPLGKEFVGQVVYEADPYKKSLGEEGKTDEDKDGNPMWPLIIVPVQKFESEENALEFLRENGISPATGGENINGELPEFSEKALSHYSNAEGVIAVADEVHKWIAKAAQGVAFNDDPENFPLPTPNTSPNQKKYVAEIYSLEVSDINLLEVNIEF